MNMICRITGPWLHPETTAVKKLTSNANVASKVCQFWRRQTVGWTKDILKQTASTQSWIKNTQNSHVGNAIAEIRCI